MAAESHVNFYGTVKLDAAGHISRELPCIACEYDLRGLTLDQDCPECGEPVRSSIEPRVDKPSVISPICTTALSLILSMLVRIFYYDFIFAVLCVLAMLLTCLASAVILWRSRTVRAAIAFLLTLALLVLSLYGLGIM